MTACEGDRASRPECGLFPNAVFSKQTFAQSTAIKTVTTQTIFVLLTQNLAQRQRNSHRFKPCRRNYYFLADYYFMDHFVRFSTKNLTILLN